MKRLLALLLLIVNASCKNATNETSNKTTDPTGMELSNLKQLVSPADSSSAEPYLFTDKNGLVYLSWVEKRKDTNWLKFSMLNNGQWTAPQVISSGNNWFVNWADYPQLAADGANSVVAHFLEKSGTGTFTYDVKLTTSTDRGKTWSTPGILHNDGKKAEHGFVSMIPYNDNYFISWLDGRNTATEGEGGNHEGHHGQMSIRGAVTDKQGKKSGDWELDNRVCDCCQTSAAITTNGPVVVYRDRSDEEIRDISIVRMVNNKWTTPKTIFPDNWKIAGCPVNGPKVVAEGNNLAVAWFSSPEKKDQVNIIFSEDGGATFKNPIRIDEGKGIGRVDMVLLDEKTAMVSWMEEAVIKAVRVHSDGRKDSSMIIATSSQARASGFPQMTKSGNNLVFAFTDEKQKTIRVAMLTL